MKEKIKPNEFKEAWNEAAEAWGLPMIKAMTEARKKKLAVRSASGVFQENWKEALNRIGESAFLCGNNDRKWRANPDWFLQSDKAVSKIVEGAYEG